ncbi:MAG: acyl carrier protein [Lachnospiraceae bacterium]|nr:acyl carrier protein [Lachnospiraceae bacterium]
MIEKEKLLCIAKDILGTEKIEMDTDMKDVGKWDSLAHVMLIAAVVENFGVFISVDDAAKIRCLGDFLKYGK